MCHKNGIRFLLAALALATVVGLLAPSLQAKSNSSSNSNSKDKSKHPQQGRPVGIYLAGYLPLPDTIVTSIAPVSDPDRQLIQLTDETHGTITIVDVGDAAKPKSREQLRLPAELAHSNVQSRMGDAILLAASETDSGAHADPQSVTLLSFTDPSNPKTIRKFEGVTALWNDGGRELIYLANADGLWILEVYSAADKRIEKQFEQMLYQ